MSRGISGDQGSPMTSRVRAIEHTILPSERELGRRLSGSGYGDAQPVGVVVDRVGSLTVGEGQGVAARLGHRDG